MAVHEQQEVSPPSEETVQEVVLALHRFTPDDDALPQKQEFRVPVRPGMTVLDGLHYIRDNIDPTLGYRFSCRMGVCGSCAMYIKGFPMLACQTQILELNADRIEIMPLPNFEVIKDVVVNLSDVFTRHRSVKPYIVRDDEPENPQAELLQRPEEAEHFLQFTYCIKCGLCLAACPTVATDPHYLGPQALAQAFRYNADTRDTDSALRAECVGGPEGPWRCHFAGACSEVCPKGVDPALAIQLLKRQMVFRNLGLGRRQKSAPVAPKETGGQRRPDIPEPPAPTVDNGGEGAGN
jgi:succinate dehydrogenase / fumarate reductase iron-sulfur subunit